MTTLRTPSDPALVAVDENKLKLSLYSEASVAFFPFSLPPPIGHASWRSHCARHYSREKTQYLKHKFLEFQSSRATRGKNWKSKNKRKRAKIDAK